MFMIIIKRIVEEIDKIKENPTTTKQIPTVKNLFLKSFLDILI